jgi:transcriptional regulator with XRE-family HTH domain
MQYQNLIGPNVRRFRIRLGFSQDELAARSNVAGWDISRGTLSKIEARIRRVNDAEVFLLARLLSQVPQLRKAFC